MVCRCMSHECVCVCVCAVEIMYGCCHAQRSLFSMEKITELCCRQIWIEMVWILYILSECRVNNSTQSNSQGSVRDLLLSASSAVEHAYSITYCTACEPYKLFLS